MKKIFLSIFLLFSLSLLGQSDCVKFLGIPIDGTQNKMIRQLQKKGYRLQYASGNVKYLEGEFNGFDANIFINTTKGKVDRVMVTPQNHKNETEIITEFNNLLYYFTNSEKYISDPKAPNNLIDSNENISYEIIENRKEYIAYFHQKYTEKEIQLLKKDILKDYDKYLNYCISYDEPTAEATNTINNNDNISQEEKADFLATIMDLMYTYHNDVWFKIYEYYGKYYIAIYYDNLYNRPGGEDL